MPNVKQLQNRLKELKKAEQKKIEQQAKMAKQGELVSDYETIRDMFSHPGWPLLKKIFQRQYEAALTRLMIEEPLPDQEVQLLRGDLIRAGRIMELDTHIAERIQSLRKSIDSNAGSVDGHPESGS